MGITDIIGYLASAFVLVSFLMKEITTLRYVNIVGCSFFILYGSLIFSAPIVITNVAIVCVNVFYLAKARRASQKG